MSRRPSASPLGSSGEGPWIELLMNFQRQIPEKVQGALEPFGYYNAQVAVVMEAIATRGSLIRVKVIPGEPIRVAAVDVRVTGPGEQNPDLNNSSPPFPLKVGDVLNQVKYEKAKEELQDQSSESRIPGIGIYLPCDSSESCRAESGD